MVPAEDPRREGPLFRVRGPHAAKLMGSRTFLFERLSSKDAVYLCTWDDSQTKWSAHPQQEVRLSMQKRFSCCWVDSLKTQRNEWS